MSHQPTFPEFHSKSYSSVSMRARAHARARARALQDNLLSPARKAEDPGVWLLYQSVAPMGTSS